MENQTMLIGIYETLTVKREGLSQYRMNKGCQFRNDCRCQLRDDDSLEQNGSYRSNEKWPDSGSVLKEKPSRFMCSFWILKTKGGVKNDTKV